MSLQIKHNNYLPNWGGRELSLKAQSDDLYDDVWGGTVSFDFGRINRPDLSPNIVDNGNEIKSLRVGAPPVVAVSVRAGNGLPLMTDNNSVKGLDLSRGQYMELSLPSKFDLLTMGDKPSAVIWAWFKVVSLPAQFRSLIDYGRLNSLGSAQWTMAHDASGIFFINVGSAGSTSKISAGSPLVVNGEYLASVFMQKVSNNNFTAHAYLNGAKLGAATRAYPFNSPTSNNPGDKPHIGSSSGGAGLMSAVLRRIGIRQVDPAYYTVDDHEEWIASQIAENSGRW